MKLDDSGLQADLVQQQIACNTSRSLAVEAESDNEAAKLALEEYEMGTFLQEERTLEGEQFVGRETCGERRSTCATVRSSPSAAT